MLHSQLVFGVENTAISICTGTLVLRTLVLGGATVCCFAFVSPTRVRGTGVGGIASVSGLTYV